MQEDKDILSAFNIIEDSLEQENEVIIESIQEDITPQEEVLVWEKKSPAQEFSASIACISEKQKIDHEISHWNKSLRQKSFWSFLFIIKYISTSLCIFGILIVGANYSAYWNLAYSILYAEEMQMTQESLTESLAASNIQEKTDTSSQVNTFRNISGVDASNGKNEDMHSMSQLDIHPSQSSVDLGIEITPYENRIIIPKIGKNIPLIDIQQKRVEWVDELNDIFMKELENWVIRYPGSAFPWEQWNSFIFWHSSNFPWLEWDYNDVFALLDHVSYDDEIVVYYGQEKHTYKIQTKNVISPWDVSVLQNNASDDRSEITLMTCWPIGTTLNRLVLTWELISVE